MKKVFREKSLQSKVDHYWVSLKTDGKTNLKRGGTRLEGDWETRSRATLFIFKIAMLT